MNLNNNILIINLFNNYFDEINIENIKKSYNWENFMIFFDFITNEIINSKDSKYTIKLYYIFTFLYINYTNFLKFLNHDDFNNIKIYKTIKKIKYNKNVLENILNTSIINHSRKIFKIYNPFTSCKLEKFKNISNKSIIIDEYIHNTKQIEKILDIQNSDYKKILNIIMYRFLQSQSLNFINYHSFYIKKILDYSIINSNNLDLFMKQIPNSKEILNIKIVNTVIPTNLKVNIEEILNFLKSQNSLIAFEIINNKIIIKHLKYGGKIVITNDISFKKGNRTIQFNCLQSNLSLIYFNIPELQDFNFIKKTNNFVLIYIDNFTFNDLSTMLYFFHIITISIKILETYPTNIYEIIYPLDYSNYYYKSFYNFFLFNKSKINNEMSYNKFIIDVIKYFYIYSYYDYYFYYTNNLIDTLMTNLKFKNEIILDFFINLKKILSLPEELFSNPPFIDIEDDINNLLYYSFEIPSYLKFYDLINSLCKVFNYKDKDFNIIKIITDIIKISNLDRITKQHQQNNQDVENTETILNSNENENYNIKINYQEKNNLNNKQISKNNNSYVELSIENSENYIFNTEI